MFPHFHQHDACCAVVHIQYISKTIEISVKLSGVVITQYSANLSTYPLEWCRLKNNRANKIHYVLLIGIAYRWVSDDRWLGRRRNTQGCSTSRAI